MKETTEKETKLINLILVLNININCITCSQHYTEIINK